MHRTLLSVMDEVSQELLRRILNQREGDKEGKLSSVVSSWKRDVIRKLKLLACNEDSLRIVREHYNYVINGLRSLGFTVIDIEARLVSRGLFGASQGILHAVFEVGMNWDYIIDLPFVASSAIKGAVRRVLTMLCSEVRREDRLACFKDVVSLLGWSENPSKNEVSELCKLLDLSYEEVRRLAKEIHGISKAVFLDAYPIECVKPVLEGWVLTPHTISDGGSEYDIEPKPVLHVVLRPGTSFRFVVGLSRDALTTIKDLVSILRIKAGPETFFSSVIASALRSGLGARTAKGYSTFSLSTIKIIKLLR